MSERVQVKQEELRVGDWIEAVTNGSSLGETATFRCRVISINGETVSTNSYVFYPDEGYVFYRLPTPAPEEPKGLGAVVQLTDEDGQPYVIVKAFDGKWIDRYFHAMPWTAWLHWNKGRPIAVKSEGVVV